MGFDKWTLEKLKKILNELDFESACYELGTYEYEFLTELCGEIEDVLRSGGAME